jgi:hypothetical protein
MEILIFVLCPKICGDLGCVGEDETNRESQINATILGFVTFSQQSHNLHEYYEEFYVILQFTHVLNNCNVCREYDGP